jgi:transposase-like protein
MGRWRRRRHSAIFKAEAVGACQQAGVSIAAVALARGLNANMLRDWVRKAERSGMPIAMSALSCSAVAHRSFLRTRPAVAPVSMVNFPNTLCGPPPIWE